MIIVGPLIIIRGGGGPSGPEPGEQDFAWTVSRDVEALDAAHETPTGA